MKQVITSDILRKMVSNHFRENRYGIILSLEEQKHYWLGFVDKAMAELTILSAYRDEKPNSIEVLEALVRIGTQNYTKVCTEISKRELN